MSTIFRVAIVTWTLASVIARSLALAEDVDRLCREALESNDAEAAEKALAAFGKLHRSEDDQEVSKGFAMLQRSASLENAVAQNTLGLAIQKGIFTSGDDDHSSRDALAAPWFFRAAEQGHPAANNNYGLLLAKGIAGDTIDDEAREDRSPLFYFLRAAARGHQGGMYNAGFALLSQHETDYDGDGGGGGGNLEAALQWFHAAAAQDPSTSVAANARLAISQLEASTLASSTSNRARNLTDATNGGGGDEMPPPLSVEDLSDRSRLLPCPLTCTDAWDAASAQMEAFTERFQALSVVDEQGFRALRAAAAHLTRLANILQEVDGTGPDYSLTPASSSSSSSSSSSASSSSSSPSSSSAWTVARAGAVLLQLQEVYSSLARADEPSELAVAGEVSAALSELPTCSALFATHEREGSCWNTAVSSAATYLRRAGMHEEAHAVATSLAHAHDKAATKYTTALQVPHVFFPGLRAVPWWDASAFTLARKLEEHHSLVSGDLDALLALQQSQKHQQTQQQNQQQQQQQGTQETVESDRRGSPSSLHAKAFALHRMGSHGSTTATSSSSSTLGLERVFNPAAPVSPSSVDADRQGSGAWSEFTLFNGTDWNAAHCAVMPHTCDLIANYSSSSSSSSSRSGGEGLMGEVCGGGGTRDASVCGTRVVATVFRLTPGSRVQPHTGTTNRRLVLQFAIRGSQGVRFRVGEEWRSYDQGAVAGGQQKRGGVEASGEESTCRDGDDRVSCGPAVAGGGGGSGDGKAIVFDDSFEHEVVHGGSEDRYVLYVALHHPDHAVLVRKKQQKEEEEKKQHQDQPTSSGDANSGSSSSDETDRRGVAASTDYLPSESAQTKKDRVGEFLQKSQSWVQKRLFGGRTRPLRAT